MPSLDIHNDGWTSWLAKSKGWTPARDWEPWLLDDQVAGYVTKYEGPGANAFTFATVKGAGHMVPQYKPKQGLALFKAFVHNAAPLY